METNFDNKTYYEYEHVAKSDKVTVNMASAVSEVSTPNAKYSTAAMVLGIISLGLIFIGIGILLPPVLQILAIVFAVKSRKYTDKKKMNGKAIAALVCAIVSLVLLITIWMVVIFIVVVTALSLAISDGLNGALEAEGIGESLKAIIRFIR